MNEYTDSKRGFDVRSSRSPYKILFDERLATDEILFVVASPVTSSILFLPTYQIFICKREALIREQESQLLTEIQTLFLYLFIKSDCNIRRNIIFQLQVTMLDGKVTNILSETESGKYTKPLQIIFTRILDANQYRLDLKCHFLKIRFPRNLRKNKKIFQIAFLSFTVNRLKPGFDISRKCQRI